ncbi:hypothetical protein [Mycolicibacter engbaekii]|nr:hypothetical protein [Mycolicibacter engbaekii]
MAHMDAADVPTFIDPEHWGVDNIADLESLLRTAASTGPAGFGAGCA